MLSVPAIYFFSLFRNRVIVISVTSMTRGRRVPAALLPGGPRQGGGRVPPPARAKA